jgi:hypothetical protein
MRGPRTLLRILLILPAVAAMGCASTTAPPGWLPIAEEAQSDVYGAWIEVACQDRSARGRVEGELIAAEPDSLFVLSDAGLVGVPVAAIAKAKLTAYDSKAKLLSSGTFVGAVTTPSHGFFLIFSAPVWIIMGSASSVAVSRTPQITHSPKSPRIEDFRKFARFPQGLPPNLDREELEPKPLHGPSAAAAPAS